MKAGALATLSVGILLALLGCRSDDDDQSGGTDDDDNDAGSPVPNDDDDAADDDNNDDSSPDDDDNDDTNPYCASPDSPDAWRKTVLVNESDNVLIAKVLIVGDDQVVVLYTEGLTTLVRAELIEGEWRTASTDFGAEFNPSSNSVDIVEAVPSEYYLAVCAHGGDLFFARWGGQPLEKELLGTGCEVDAGLAVDTSLTVHLAASVGDSTWTYWRGGPSNWTTETATGSTCLGHVFAIGSDVFVGGYDREENGSAVLLHRGDAGWEREMIRQTPLGARAYGQSVFVTPEEDKFAAYSLLWDYGPPPEHSGLLVARKVGDSWQEFTVDRSGWYPMLVVDSQDNWHVLYEGDSHDGFGVRYAFVTRAGEAHTSKICEEPNCTSRAIAVDSSGCAHLLYHNLTAGELVYQANRKAD